MGRGCIEVYVFNLFHSHLLPYEWYHFLNVHNYTILDHTRRVLY
jgi:hypothetical protein